MRGRLPLTTTDGASASTFPVADLRQKALPHGLDTMHRVSASSGRVNEYKSPSWIAVTTNPTAYAASVGSDSSLVRPARVEDAAEMAHVNVQRWQETYRGLIRDEVIDDPGLMAARERFWTAALSDRRDRDNRAAVAERAGVVIGIAMSGPAEGSNLRTVAASS